MERRLVLRNIICSLALQFVTIVSGFIIPKVILSYFGSDINGLISSINQFLNYIQLLEGGLSSVVMAALYKPLNDNDTEKISSIIKATEMFFRKIAFIFLAYTIIVAIGYPMLFKTGFSYSYSLVLVVVLAMNLFVQYFFSLTYKLLLNADRKVYIVSLTQIVIIVLNMAAVIICAKIFHDVLIIKLVSALIFLIQPIVYGTCVKKHYSLNRNAEPDNVALSQRWDGFGINLAYFVHTNTDVIILTIFSSLANVSVYSVYLLIVNAMKNLVLSVSQAIVPSFGKVLASDNQEESNTAFDIYEFGIDFITIFIFACGLVLITPFVKVYTLGINDANYIQHTFGYILVLAEMVYCFRDPYIAVTYTAGHFKQVTKYAIIEVVINLVISLSLVVKMGITGVAIGTLVSMIYRMVSHVFYLKINILYRSPWIAIKKFVVYGLVAFVSSFICINIFDSQVNTYWEWFELAIKVGLVTLAINGSASWLFYRQEFNMLVSRLFFKR